MANDFSGDSNCVALFKFDNNANDSKGGNDLTAVNSPSYDSGDKKEGSYSIDLEKDSTQYCTIDDGDLDAGFPGKSGTGEQSFSICFWVKLESLDSSAGLICKYNWSLNERSYGIYVPSSYDYHPIFVIGYNGGASYSIVEFGTALSTGIWYHIAIIYDSSDNGMKIRIWDDDAGALLDSNATGTADGDMSPDSAPLEVGRVNELDSYCLDGKVDEVVIFKDVLTDSEIDQIRAGNYGAGVTEKNASDAGSGIDAVESLQTLEAKTSSDTGTGIEVLISRLLTDDESGNAIEVADVEGEGQPEDVSASEPGEGTDRLVAKIETPTKGGGLKL